MYKTLNQTAIPHDDMDARQDQSMLFVSLIIVARNAEKYLINLLADYLRQDYPVELRELIMVDGGSEDDTKKVAQDFALQHPELAITILDNPKQTPACSNSLSNFTPWRR